MPVETKTASFGIKQIGMKKTSEEESAYKLLDEPEEFSIETALSLELLRGGAYLDPTEAGVKERTIKIKGKSAKIDMETASKLSGGTLTSDEVSSPATDTIELDPIKAGDYVSLKGLAEFGGGSFEYEYHRCKIESINFANVRGTFMITEFSAIVTTDGGSPGSMKRTRPATV